MADSPSRFLQENLLVLLCFDKDFAPLIVNNVDVKLFDNAVYREIASQAVGFYKRYGSPIENHLPDVLEDVLAKKDATANLYVQTIKNLHASKDTVKKEYIADELEKFVKTQNLKQDILDAANHLQKGNVDKAEEVIQKNRNGRLKLFDPGIQFGIDVARTLNFLDSHVDIIPTGIEALERLNIGPASKELFVFIAPKGRGKSWFLINLTKWAYVHRYKILYITLEMSQDRVSGRLVQSMFGLPRRSIPPFRVPIFKTDKYGTFLDLDMQKIEKEEYLFSPGMRKKLQQRLNAFKKPRLIIKEFPTGQLTVPALRAYISNLQDFSNFTPDLLIIDYIDLMKMDLEMLRLNLGQTYIELRGLGVEYGMAVVTPSQSNRAAEDAKLITGKYLAEDYSKGMTADTIVTYNQNSAEKSVGLARLFIDKSRNEEDGRTILISQAYSIGQFCLSSSILPKDYEAVVLNSLLEKGKAHEARDKRR